MNLEEAQLRQREFDAQHWAIDADDFQKLRHITLHLTVALGKLGRHCERAEHGEVADSRQIVEEVTPDLFLYSLQLANIFGLSLLDSYEARLRSNAQKHARGSVQSSRG